MCVAGADGLDDPGPPGIDVDTKACTIRDVGGDGDAEGLAATTAHAVIWYNTWTGAKITHKDAPANAAGDLTFTVHDLTASTAGAADRFGDETDPDIKFDRDDIAFKVKEQ